MSKQSKSTITKRIGEADPVLSMGQRAWDFISGQWPAITTFFATGGGVTLLAIITDWARALGPLGIGLIVIAAAFVGMVSVSAFQANIAKRQLRRSQTDAIDKWKQDSDTVNPLEDEFNKKRIVLTSFFNPLDKKSSGKRFFGCELIGPANLVFLTTKPGTIINGVRFMGCDIVVAKPDVPMMNVFALEDVQIIGGAIYNCTIIIPPDLVQLFRQMGANFVTLTGDPQIDSQLPSGTGQKTRP